MLQELAPCACGLHYAGGCGGRCGGAAASSAFSLLFPMAAGQCYHWEDEEEKGRSPYGGGPVDCTLSLGTPSTRRAEATVGLARDAASTRAYSGRQDGGGASCKEPGRGLPARRCANCDTTSTPLWRNGPRGPKSLCNACGIRYKKEERRAAAAVAPAPQDGGLGYAWGGYARQQQQQWGCYGPAAAKSASYAMYGDVVDAAADGPCLSWMLNVMPPSPAFAVRDRPTLFQYYKQ
ncbi:GATA transcription factor 15-like [Phragmites australis]|uniref:GATA transcription factor 15-like n=1 Tax=Phragmites australis TaxID=29695 RepID=UPI002D79520C|nr:GATA transcription factor 15-like [Phragmites australis]